MVYFKLYLNDKRVSATGLYAVMVRVTSLKRNTSFTTGVRIKSRDWDVKSLKVRSSHPSSQAYNKQISAFYNKVQQVSSLLVSSEAFSFESLKANLYTDKPASKPMVPTFKEFTGTLVQDMRLADKVGNAAIYVTASTRFLDYWSKPDIKFTEITYVVLEGFRNRLLQEGLRTNSVSNYFRTIRAIYNKAMKAKIVDRSYYPFVDISVPPERTVKRSLSSDVFQRFVEKQLTPSSPACHARNFFLLSFSLIGMSFVDLAHLQQSNIIEGRIEYKRRKTDKLLSIQLQPLALCILAMYRSEESSYLLPVLRRVSDTDAGKKRRVVMQWIKVVNKQLQKIASSIDAGLITTYVARHSWATTAKRLGYSVELISEAMGHEHGSKITNIYLAAFDPSNIDMMNHEVCSIIPISIQG